MPSIHRSVLVTAALTLRLSGWMIDLEIKWLGVGSLHHSDVGAGPLVCFGQCVGPPVCPVNLSTIHSNGKRMGQVFMAPQNFNQPRTIILGWINGVRSEKKKTFFSDNVPLKEMCSSLFWPGIDPKDAPLQIVHSESIWPASIACLLVDGLPAFPTHGCSFNSWQTGIPVSPEEDSTLKQKDKQNNRFLWVKVIQTNSVTTHETEISLQP